MNNIFSRTYRSLRNEGMKASLRKAVWWVGEFCRVFYATLTIRSKVRGLKRDALIDFVFTKYDRVIKPIQLKSEIAGLMDIVKEAGPETIIEIGTASGGTLALLCHSSSENAIAIRIDLPYGRGGGGYPAWRRPLYRACARPGQRLHLIRKSSHENKTLKKVKKILKGAPVDFLFIDGDHAYEGVKRDFEMYSPLVSSGGIIALHDIAKHPPDTMCNVYKFWEEIKSSYKNVEIIADKDQSGFGIGVLYVGHQ